MTEHSKQHSQASEENLTHYQLLLYEAMQEVLQGLQESPAKGIHRAFAKIGKHLGFDRIGLILLSEDGLMAEQVISWNSEKWLYDDTTEFYSIAQFPWFMRQIRDGQPVMISELEQIPPAAFSEREYFETYGIQSFAARPLYKEGKNKPVGFWHLDATSSQTRLDNTKLSMLAPLETAILAVLNAQEQLRQTESALEERNLLLNHTDIQIWYMVNPTVYGSANEAHAHFFGKAASDMVHCEVYSVFDPVSADAFAQVNLEVFEKKQPLQREFPIKNFQQEERVLMISWNPMLDDSGEVPYIICSAHDITALKQTQQALIKAKEASEVANVAKSQFLANMSHEIRTPIHGIMGFLELLSLTPLDEPQKDFLSGARSSSDVLLHIINDILDISKIEAGKYTLEHLEFSLPAIVKNALSVIKPRSIEKKLRLTTDISSDIPEVVLGDPTRLEQVLNNLLGNAVKFTQQGEITVSLKLKKKSSNHAFIQFEVKDTGIGIPADSLEQLFNPFTQADGSTTRKYGGTGLGLAISKELVTLMGGEMGVTSTPGEGSVFWFTVNLEIPQKIPLLTAAPLGKEAAFTLADAYTVYPRLLIVDDHPMNRKILSKLLEKRNIPCDVVTNGKEALTACLEKEYDIVFMDCQMPVMDGYESTAQIRQAEKMKRHTVIIAMTANAMAGDREKCLAAGMDDYISKPIQPAGIFSMIKKYFPALS